MAAIVQKPILNYLILSEGVGQMLNSENIGSIHLY
jgi:hypothetical protein